jgi:hypothetical protein
MVSWTWALKRRGTPPPGLLRSSFLASKVSILSTPLGRHPRVPQINPGQLVSRMRLFNLGKN